MDITFACESCGQSIVVEEAGAGQLVDCPKCGKPIEVPYKSDPLDKAATLSPAMELSSASVYRERLIGMALLFLISFLWAVVVTALWSRTNRKLIILSNSIDKIEKDAESDRRAADARLGAAKEEAAKIVAAAEADRQQAQNYIIREQENLNTVFGNLHKYRPGKNDVGQSYLSYFEVSGGRIRTFMANDTSEDVRPNFDIHFVNRYGFITEDFHKSWLI